MNFVRVLVGTAQYHGQAELTYSSEELLSVGSIVLVPLRQQKVLGVVTGTADKPSFPARPVLESFSGLKPLPTELMKLLEWIATYYPAPLGTIANLFLPKKMSKKHLNNSFDEQIPDTNMLPPLTKDQQYALGQIEASGVHLLHGETGSGKTRVYMELAKRAFVQHKSTLILTPEIGLTSQLVENLQIVFGGRVLVLHSQLSEGRRHEIWTQVLQSTQPLIIVGPRSALFSPLRSLGLIVVDEAHETAYKQEQAPYYQAIKVAAKLGQLHDCAVLFGSATPPVAEYFWIEQKKRPIIRMRQLATGTVDQPVDVKIVDLKDRRKFSKHSYLSDVLLEKIAMTLAKNEQILLFLNRRGTARVVFCERCGWQATCPHCDIPMIYHADTHSMRCHTCSYHLAALTSCPDCRNTSILFKSIGTKALVEEVGRLFAKAKIARFDTDTKKSDRLERQYGSVREGGIDILIGTQTLAKGLDLPRLGMVGIIMADTSLFLPDYNAQERTYQLLSQVLGRVGRGHRSSSTVIQTYSPKSPLLKQILNKDWEGFYKSELREREAFLFPPFCHILKLSCRRATQSSAEKAAKQLAAQIAAEKFKVKLEGPAPAFHEKIGGRYQWQIIIKAKQRDELLGIIKHLPSGWTYDIDPSNLL